MKLRKIKVFINGASCEHKFTKAVEVSDDANVFAIMDRAIDKIRDELTKGKK